jgi:hypothetical protein
MTDLYAEIIYIVIVVYVIYLYKYVAKYVVWH